MMRRFLLVATLVMGGCEPRTPEEKHAAEAHEASSVRSMLMRHCDVIEVNVGGEGKGCALLCAAIDCDGCNNGKSMSTMIPAPCEWRGQKVELR